MTSDQVIVTIIGVAGIVFTYWFFLMKKTKAIAAAGSVDIIVDGGYSPEVIAIPKGKTTRINFLRKDPSSCLEEVIVSDFKIRKRLPMNEKVAIDITPSHTGEFRFTCGMNMYHGKIIVKEAA